MYNIAFLWRQEYRSRRPVCHISFYTFWILNMWPYYYLFSKFNKLEDKIKHLPTDTTSVEQFFVLTASVPFSHLLAAYWQRPRSNAEPGHSPAGGKRPLQPDTRPWHYQAVAPGLSDCILSPVRSWLAPSEEDRLMGPNGRKREEGGGPYYTKFHCPTQGSTKPRMMSTFTHPTNTFKCPPRARRSSSDWGYSSEYKLYIPHSLLHYLPNA